MKAYVTSIGENTTEICCEQLRRFGFEVILLAGVEPWIDKYKKFIDLAIKNNESCLRVDADVIVNSHVTRVHNLELINQYFNNVPQSPLMLQFKTFSFYKNDFNIGNPVYYSIGALLKIKENIDSLDVNRPEASAWRLPEVNKHTFTIDNFLIGMQSFFQDQTHYDRHLEHKIQRKQIEEYDFELAQRILNQFLTIKF